MWVYMGSIMLETQHDEIMVVVIEEASCMESARKIILGNNLSK